MVSKKSFTLLVASRTTPFFVVVPIFLSRIVANMADLQYNDNETWHYLEHNFSVSKCLTTFTEIGSDHAMEQENKSMKVNVGITGLTQQPSALNLFCLIAPVLSSLSEEFLSLNQISEEKRKHHYQLSGSSR